MRGARAPRLSFACALPLLAVTSGCKSSTSEDPRPAPSASAASSVSAQTKLDEPALDAGKIAARDAAPPPSLARKLEPPARAWSWDYPKPQGNAIHGAAFAPSGVVVAVGDVGTVVRSTDHGLTWSAQTIDTHDLVALAMTDGGEAFAVAHDGLVARSRDDGLTWEALPTAALTGLRAIWASRAGDVVVAVGSHGIVARSSDHGATWTEPNSGVDEELLAVWGSASSDIYAAGKSRTLLHSTNGGATWSPATKGTSAARRGASGAINAVWGAPSGDVYAADDDGNVYRKPKSGARFDVEATPPHTPSNLAAICGNTWGDLFVAGAAGRVLSRTPNADAGTAWSELKTDTSAHFSAIACKDREVFAFAANGLIARSTDAGAKWTTSLPKGSSMSGLVALWGDAKTLVALSWDEDVYRSTDQGATWSAHKTGAKQVVSSLWGASADDLYAVGEEGIALHSTNGGTSWTEQKVGVEVALHGVWVSATGDAFAVGEDGTIVHKARGGAWTTQISPTRRALRGVWGRSATDVYAVGMSGTILHTTDGGARWVVQPTRGALSLVAIAGTPAGAVYAVGDKSILRATADGPWAEAATVPFPLQSVAVGASGDVHAVGYLGVASSADGAHFTTDRFTSAKLHVIWKTPAGRILVLGPTAILHLDGPP